MGGASISAATGREKPFQIVFGNANGPADTMDDQLIVFDPAVNRARGDIELLCDCSNGEELRTMYASTIVRCMSTNVTCGVHHACPPDGSDEVDVGLDCSTWRAIDVDIQVSISAFR